MLIDTDVPRVASDDRCSLFSLRRRGAPLAGRH
jgi:hypothetical protein